MHPPGVEFASDLSRLHGRPYFDIITKSRCLGYFRGRDNAVGIATGYGLDDRGAGVRVPVGSRIFSSPRHPDRLWSPPKWPRREADHSSPANVEVKKMWIYTSTPPYAFMA
jgi:hypothetical protein